MVKEIEFWYCFCGNLPGKGYKEGFWVIEVFSMSTRVNAFVKPNQTMCLKTCAFYYIETVRKKPEK